jgi:hypothetical protein
LNLAEVISRVIQRLWETSFPLLNRTTSNLVPRWFSKLADGAGRALLPAQKTAADESRRLVEAGHMTSCSVKCSDRPDKERSDPATDSLERAERQVVKRLSAERQLIALPRSQQKAGLNPADSALL